MPLTTTAAAFSATGRGRRAGSKCPSHPRKVKKVRSPSPSRTIIQQPVGSPSRG